MNTLVSWQLVFFLCTTSFRGTVEKMATPGSPGLQLGPQALLTTREQSLCCAETKSSPMRPLGSPQYPSTHSPEGLRRAWLWLFAPRRRLIPTPRGTVLVQREKEPEAYNRNSFGLRYGKRQAGGRGARRG
ncbi:metastasis-suppressor KiSS-1 [Suncus etruscus]|uniref:metastasis-suppressor KiSS-1 n=1 Tax=Suncus etruscus TaxID=109475 RepID=UPI002110AB5B|nr:metastasis-suppressor KiSS-1 [Suncus etruscus]